MPYCLGCEVSLFSTAGEQGSQSPEGPVDEWLGHCGQHSGKGHFISCHLDNTSSSDSSLGSQWDETRCLCGRPSHQDGLPPSPRHCQGMKSTSLQIRFFFFLQMAVGFFFKSTDFRKNNKNSSFIEVSLLFKSRERKWVISCPQTKGKQLNCISIGMTSDPSGFGIMKMISCPSETHP